VDRLEVRRPIRLLTERVSWPTRINETQGTLGEFDLPRRAVDQVATLVLATTVAVNRGLSGIVGCHLRPA
jgi:hypothetical protein